MRRSRAGFAIAAGLLAMVCGAPPGVATPLTLRQAAAAAGIYVGAATSPAELASGVDAIVARDFDSLTAENQMKWSGVAPAPGVYDFGPADALVDFAEANGMRVRGHTLVWGRSNGPPVWLGADLAAAPDPAAHLRDLMLDHIDTVAGRYAGRIESWDVVNEPLAFTSGALDASNPYFRLLGEGYIAEAFHAARAVDPNAKLFLNEFATERIPEKFAGLVALVEGLLADGVPIDGVGFQGHFLTRPDRAALEAQLRTFAEMGLLVEITELDLPLVIFSRDVDPLASQAQAYADVFAACLAVSACRGITTWGVTDADSWLDDFDLLRFFAPNQPLLFDADGLPKPAYDAVLATLVAAPEPATLVQLTLGITALAIRARSPNRAGARPRA
jgi:endo-1,4-beta-xylanase